MKEWRLVCKQGEMSPFVTRETWQEAAKATLNPVYEIVAGHRRAVHDTLKSKWRKIGQGENNS